VTAVLDAPPRYVRLGPERVVRVGALAGTDVPHRHAADQGSGSSCLACFGWADDVRHLIRVPRVRRKTDLI
jgi:hypothetical protein